MPALTQQQEDAQRRKITARFRRAQELLAHADVTGIEIGFEGEHTTFKPADRCPQRFIEEATILSHEIKHLMEKRGTR